MTAGPMLAAAGLSKVYLRLGRRRVVALAGVDLEVAGGETLAVVGESGSGKSTLGRCLALLEAPDAGEIRLAGEPCQGLDRRRLRVARRRVQLIFQDPSAALNPRFTALEAVTEPLRIAGSGDGAARRDRGLALMAEVGLGEELATRRPGELSGGQRQRLAIARALAAEPRVLILDEALAGLDLSLQARVVNLLREIQQRRQLSYLFISHDLRRVVQLADRVLVLAGGEIVEEASPAELWAAPRHPASRELVSAARLGDGALADEGEA